MNPSRATPQQLVANNDGRKPHWPRPLLLPRPSPSPSLDRMNNSKCARGINEMSWSMRKEGRKVTAVGSHKQFLRQEEDKIRIRGPKILLVICKLKKKTDVCTGNLKKRSRFSFSVPNSCRFLFFLLCVQITIKLFIPFSRFFMRNQGRSLTGWVCPPPAVFLSHAASDAGCLKSVSPP